MNAFLVALGVAGVATPIVAYAARRAQLVDTPNHRSSHRSPTPRGGGIAVAIGVVVAMGAAGDITSDVLGLAIGASVLGVVGLIDDRMTVSAVPRLVAQLVTPFVIALAISDRAGAALWFVALLAAVIVAGYVNAFNFMDGINGISGLQALLAALFLAAIGAHLGMDALRSAGLVMAGAALGFLPFNGGRALLFLGDVGSYFMGFWLAGLALLVVDAGAPGVVVVAPFLLYLLDTSSVLVRRARRRERLMEAHREHAYQRLVQAGWPHLAVATLTALVAAASAVAMYSVLESSGVVQWAVLTACVALVGVYLALPGVIDRHRRVEAA